MLTPEQIAEARQKYGIEPKTTSSRVQEVESAWNTPVTEPAKTPATTKKDNVWLKPISGILAKSKQAIQEGGEDVTQLIGEQAKKYGEEDSLLGKTAILGQTLGRAAMDTAKTAGKLFAAPIAQGMETAAEAIGETGTAQKVAQSPIVSKALDSINNFIGSGIENYDEWKTANPELAKDVEGVAEIILLATGEKATTESVRRFIQATKNIEAGVGRSVAEGARLAENILESGSKIKKLPSEIVEKTVSKAKDILQKPIPKQVETTLSRTKPEVFDKYVDIGKKASLDNKLQTPLEETGNRAVEALNQIDRKLKTIGSEKTKVISGPDGDKTVGNIVTKFRQDISKFVGGRTMTQGDNRLVNQVVAEAQKLGANPTARQVDQFVDYVQDLVYTSGRDLTLPTTDDSVAAIRNFTGRLNSSLKEQMPSSYSNLNKRFTDMVETRNELNVKLGKDAEKGGALMKRVFSPSDANTKKLFEDVKKITGIDLVDEAVVARYVMETVGDARQASLLEQLNLPRSKEGIVEWAFNKAVQRLNTPDELLARAREKTIKPTTTETYNAANSKAKAGESTNKINQSMNNRMDTSYNTTVQNARDITAVLNDADQNTLLQFADLRAGAKPSRIPKELRQEVIGILEENLGLKLPEKVSDDTLASMIRDMFDSSFSNQADASLKI